MGGGRSRVLGAQGSRTGYSDMAFKHGVTGGYFVQGNPLVCGMDKSTMCMEKIGKPSKVQRIAQSDKVSSYPTKQRSLTTSKSYRYRFKLIDSPKCRACGINDSILHMIFICRRHTMARITLRTTFELGPMLRKAQALQAVFEFFNPQLTTYARYSGGSA